MSLSVRLKSTFVKDLIPAILCHILAIIHCTQSHLTKAKPGRIQTNFLLLDSPSTLQFQNAAGDSGQHCAGAWYALLHASPDSVFADLEMCLCTTTCTRQ